MVKVTNAQRIVWIKEGVKHERERCLKIIEEIRNKKKTYSMGWNKKEQDCYDRGYEDSKDDVLKELTQKVTGGK